MKSPADLHLPWTDWRPGQRLAIRTAITSKKPHIVIQAPTGAGKTAIAGAIAAWTYEQERAAQVESKLTGKPPTIHAPRSAILTATNGLMRQYEDTLPWLAPIRGAANYECLAARDELKKYFRMVKHTQTIMCDDGPCRSNIKCSMKEAGCTYYDANRHAKASRNIVTNYAYWLAVRRFGQGLGTVDQLLLDEAHALPEELMKAHEIRVPKWLLRGTRYPQSYTGWAAWASVQLTKQPNEGAERDDERVKVRKLRETYKALTEIDADWAWDVTPDAVVFQPTIPRKLMPMLIQPGTPTVYFSATITPALLSLLDIPMSSVEFHAMPSRFPVEHRPVYILKTARVGHNMSGFESDYWMHQIDKIIGQRVDRKGIIHTVSYARAEEIVRRSKHGGMMLAPRGAAEHAKTIQRFKQMSGGAILVSPAVMTGYDFKGDEARYQILAKMPFPDTRSAIMRARIEATARYRDNLTMQAVVQMAGRIVREDDDWGETFIVDDHANWFLSQHADLAPQSFLDALQWVKRIPAPPALDWLAA